MNEYTIIAESGLNSSLIVKLSGILFGDVYVCSGQSNMQFTITQGFTSDEQKQEQIANNSPYIRLFTAGLTGSGNQKFAITPIFWD